MASNSQEETIYGNMTTSMSSESGALGGGGGGGSSNSSDSHAVMNEKVQAIAGTVYEEFERMISKYDQDVVKNLMPLIVNVLENLDLSFTETQELEVECELLKEDNEQLVTQYEREKQLRKSAEGKTLEIEDTYEGERKDAMMKIESLTSIVKMFELKTKNFQDQSKSKLLIVNLLLKGVKYFSKVKKIIKRGISYLYDYGISSISRKKSIFSSS